MVVNGGIASIAVIVNCGQWSDVVIQDINIENKKFIVYSPDCEVRGAHLKCFRIRKFVNSRVNTEANHAFDIHEPAFLLVSLLCMC